jgi:hypothetical protein
MFFSPSRLALARACRAILDENEHGWSPDGLDPKAFPWENPLAPGRRQ